MKYIDAEKLKAEIKRLEEMDYPCDTLEQSAGFYDALDRIKSFIASLQQEQKSAEWSEDERIRKAIMGLTYIDGIEPILIKCSITAQDIRKYLEKQQEQKPAWSEEDEAMRDNILRLLSYFVGTVECDSNPSLSTSYLVFQREMNWLKSLKPQPKQDWIKEQTKKQ